MSAAQEPTPKQATLPAAILGVDVSQHQPEDIDWHAVKAAGYSFVIIKLQEGETYEDPHAAAHYKGAGDAGLARGAYLFSRPQRDPRKMAQAFCARWNAFGVWELPPAIDLEPTKGDAPFIHAMQPGQYAKNAYTLCASVAAGTKRNPLVYSYGSWFGEQGLTPLLKGFPLWLADYRSVPHLPPGGWFGWAILQHSGDGKVPGCSTPIDLNRADPAVYNRLLK